MVEEFQEEDFEPKLDSYEDLVSEAPERDLEGDDFAVRSLTEAEEETEQKTDLQAAMRYMLPKFKDKRINELMQTAMVSRIPPDNYIDKHFLITASLIEDMTEEEEDVDVVGIISQVQDGLLIGYEGRCRVELAEIAGVAHEEEMEKLSKELGL